jgi:hypothetical protein
MSVNQRPQVAYGLSQPDFATVSKPISSTRIPTATDFAAIGTIWINTATNAVYILTNVAANSATWTIIS